MTEQRANGSSGLGAGADTASQVERPGRRWSVWVTALLVGVGVVGVFFVMGRAAAGPTRIVESRSGGWETILSEDFSDGIGPVWTTLDATDDAGRVTWGVTAYLSRSAGHSAWCVGGGADGGQLDPGEDVYPDNVDSWLIGGPFELDDALDGYLEFDWWLETQGAGNPGRPWAALQRLEDVHGPPPAGDWFGWCILTNELDLAGARCTYVSGSTGAWVRTALPLGDLLPDETGGAEQFWIAFRFVSDDDGIAGRGAFLDDVTLRVRRVQKAFLPLVRRGPALLPPTPTATSTPTATPTATPTVTSSPTVTPSPTPHGTPVPAGLVNGGFEADWSEGGSHLVLIFPTDGDPYGAEMGNVFTPPGWLTWYLHGKPVEHDPMNPHGWVQPEVKDAWADHDPVRVHSGHKAIHMFKTWGIFDGGFLQQVSLEPESRLRAAAFAHAWSSQRDDPRWSEGPGGTCGFKLEGETWDDDWRNFTFWVGIDPTGGQDPYADTVTWGQGAHIYNCHDEVPPVETVAENATVTVFLRARTLWGFKHNNAYWDDVTLEIIP